MIEMNDKDIKESATILLNKITELLFLSKPATDSLFVGELAIAFYFAYLYELTGEQIHYDTAIIKLENVLNNFNENKTRLYGPYYCYGLSGLLFIITLFIKKGLIDAEIQHDADELEEQLVESVLAGIEQDYNDILVGSFGTLNVLLDYAVLKNNFIHINTILRLIEYRYLQHGNPWIVSKIVDDSPLSQINFSFSHGQTGLLQVLLNAYTIVGCNTETRQSLKRCIDYILSFYSEAPIKNTLNHFPYLIDTTNDTIKSSKRLAWCYGDFGHILLLHKAAIFFNDKAYLQAAEKVGKFTTLRKTYETTLINESHLCHGTSGVAHIYLTLAKIGNQDIYYNLYLYWIKQTIVYLNAELSKEISHHSLNNILEGLPGTGLALMSFLSTTNLDWGRIIFI